MSASSETMDFGLPTEFILHTKRGKFTIYAAPIETFNSRKKRVKKPWQTKD